MVRIAARRLLRYDLSRGYSRIPLGATDTIDDFAESAERDVQEDAYFIPGLDISYLVSGYHRVERSSPSLKEKASEYDFSSSNTDRLEGNKTSKLPAPKARGFPLPANVTGRYEGYFGTDKDRLKSPLTMARDDQVTGKRKPDGFYLLSARSARVTPIDAETAKALLQLYPVVQAQMKPIQNLLKGEPERPNAEKTIVPSAAASSSQYQQNSTPAGVPFRKAA